MTDNGWPRHSNLQRGCCNMQYLNQLHTGERLDRIPRSSHAEFIGLLNSPRS